MQAVPYPMGMATAHDPNSTPGTEVAEDAAPERGEDTGPSAAGSPAQLLPAGPTAARAPLPPVDLSEPERRLLGDLFAIVAEHAADSAVQIDRVRVQEAFVFACEHHAAQRRRSGEDFIVHPVGVARICASMRLDTETLCAALLHDTVEDTSASIEEVRERFGEEIAGIVAGGGKEKGRTFR